MKSEHIIEMDREKVNKILENAFLANNLEPNTVPLDVLESYGNYRKERFLLQGVILIIVLICFALMPLLFVTPKLAMCQSTDETPGKPTYDLLVETFMPVKWIKASVDGVNMPVYEVGENLYSVCPTRNGEMVVSVLLINDQSGNIKTLVSGVDLDAPVLTQYQIEDGELAVYVKDEGLGINYEKTYAKNTQGTVIAPVSFDKDKGRIAFAYPREPINIYVTDNAENTLQLVAMIQKGD